MGSSSSFVFGGGNGDSIDLRYETMSCHCKCRAAIKIVGPTKGSRGKLYFSCEKRACNFFSWCNPVTVSGIAMHTPSDRGLQVQDTIALATQLHSLSQTVASLKKQVNLVLLVLFIVVLMGSVGFFK